MSLSIISLVQSLVHLEIFPLQRHLILQETRVLRKFQLSGNHLTGEIPSSVYNVSSLVFLSVTQNNLGGKLPNDIVQAPPNLRQLYFTQNSFEGIVPGSISNASGIEYLDLSMNRFHGPVPLFGNMKKLIWLNLGSNFLSSTTALNFQLIDYLTSCKQLEILMLFFQPACW
ncbi:hypothetical protein SCA6_016398 [Theobroma cacao]